MLTNARDILSSWLLKWTDFTPSEGSTDAFFLLSFEYFASHWLQLGKYVFVLTVLNTKPAVPVPQKCE